MTLDDERVVGLERAHIDIPTTIFYIEILDMLLRQCLYVLYCSLEIFIGISETLEFVQLFFLHAKLRLEPYFL